MHNLSSLSDEETATTCPECAEQRAFNLAARGVRSVLELCVGPSLRTLSAAYRRHGIYVVGNDIDPRWKDDRFTFEVGDCLEVSWQGVDAVVFAPPLSRGCTGKREDSLSVAQVTPSYQAFLRELVSRRFVRLKVVVMVLPARALATRQDRVEYHELLHRAGVVGRVTPVELVAGRRRIRKYLDLYVDLGVS